MDWTREEIEVIVADYLQMLALELAGQKYNKTEHRTALRTRLNDRSDGSVEFKHCNISAVLIELGRHPIRGYQPRYNYQGLLAEVVAEQLRSMPSLDQLALAAVQQPAITPSLPKFDKVMSEAPKRQWRASESTSIDQFRAVKRDYIEQEAHNRSLGAAGEEFVVQFEHWRLIQQNHHRLADRVEHVARTKGDGLGYDVLSFDASGKERFIEVKTTSFGKDTPFFVSQRELSLSKDATPQFHLYRLFEFRQSPRLFDLPGALDQHCQLDPLTYRASFG